MEPMREHDQPEESELPPMRAQDYSEMEDWPGYFGAVLGKEPRETLVAALDSFTHEGFAGGAESQALAVVSCGGEKVVNERDTVAGIV